MSYPPGGSIGYIVGRNLELKNPHKGEKSMITQVYGITSIEDALGSIAAGADYIGIGVRSDGVSFEKCRDIFNAVGDKAVKVAILDFVFHNEDDVLKAAEELKPDILHLSGSVTTSKAFFERFRKTLPDMKLMQAVPVSGPEAIALAEERMRYADYLLLDSVAHGGAIGATGASHDVTIDAEIVKRSIIPVIIAGGLGPDNVAEAIRIARPFGVDTLSKTSINGSRFYGKDLNKVRLFCKNARKAAEELGL